MIDITTKMLKLILISTFTLSCFLDISAQTNTVGQIIQSKQALEVNSAIITKIRYSAFDSVLADFKLEGSILLYDPVINTYFSNDFKWSETKHLPASTYKIPNSIIALETGVIESDSTIIKWDGKPRKLKIWEQDLMFSNAFRISCVPCYQEIARRVGFDRMTAYLNKLAYPGMVFDESTIDKFWLEGESKISQFQQIEFLERFYNSQLPISKKTYAIVKEIMLFEKTDQYALSGKTGWGIRGEDNNGWYVGFIETGGKVYYFATNVNPSKGFNLDNFTTARIEVTKEALRNFGLIK